MTTRNDAYAAEFTSLRECVNARLATYFSDAETAPSLSEAMRYSVAAGGKRVRPVLVLKFYEAALGAAATDAALDAACAVELLHTYSLIHDDLPCMDDDALRRGMPSNHVVFGVWRATLAGDALQAEAFDLLLSSGLPPERVVKMARALALAAGSRGICAGQTLDMEAEARGADAEGLFAIHTLKTAALLEAACVIGVAAAGGTAAQETSARQYARALGLAFQIRDDTLDVSGDETRLGKPVGSDEKNGKATFVTEFGAARCEEMIAAETSRAESALQGAFGDAGFLVWLARELAGRSA